MVLAKFAEYERRHTSAGQQERPTGYEERPVRWIIELDSQGQPQGGSLSLAFTPLSGGQPQQRGKAKGRARDRGKLMAIPYIRPTSDIKPSLLAGNAEYALGVLRKADDPARAQKRHKAFVDLAIACAATTHQSVVEAVTHFLQETNLDSTGSQLPKEFSPDDILTFRVDGKLVTELPAVRAFWAERFQQASQSSARMRKAGRTTHALEPQGLAAQCLVCGESRPIARTHPVAIQGIPGGDAKLVSFNEDAFMSYGLGQSYNAPVCVACAQEYARGLNRLLAGEDFPDRGSPTGDVTTLRIGDMKYVFWTREPSDAPAQTVKTLGKPQEVKGLLETPWAGGLARTRPQRIVSRANAFYAAAFTRHEGRAVLLDWLETTVEAVGEHLDTYVRLQVIPRWYEDQQPFFSIPQLLTSLLPAKRRRGGEAPELDARAAAALLHLALDGTLLPDWILYQAVRRNRGDQAVTPQRTVLIKLAIMSHQHLEYRGKEPTLDTATQQTPAYLCGCLLAILERAQYLAIGDTNTTLIGRFYSSASSAPASVFGTLIRNAQVGHLPKLRREKRGAYVNIQKDMERVFSTLSYFPPTLTMKQQAIFALGYYYQRATRSGGDNASNQPTSASQEPSA